MTLEREWLVDKSALVRLTTSSQSDQWLERIERGLVHISSLTILEVGFSARSADDWTALVKERPVNLMPIESLTPRTESRAVEVQGVLARSGRHRAPSIPDLLIAATAELGDLTVLHHDKDFDLIASITGQPVEQLRPA